MQCDKIENIIIYPPSLPMFFSAERIDLSMRALFAALVRKHLYKYPYILKIIYLMIKEVIKVQE